MFYVIIISILLDMNYDILFFPNPYPSQWMRNGKALFEVIAFGDEEH